MNYEKLAELLFPNINKTTEYYENKYPQRDCKGEVTRFAPSPTGFLHIGHFFGSLIDSRIASSSNGVFYFRLEDTDKKREIEGAGLVALEVMKIFGIVPDEGLMPDGTEKGNYGPYVQSQRLEIYHTYAKELVRQGKAFPCFCEKADNKAEIIERREQQLQESDTIVEHDPCRDLTLEEIEEKLKAGKPFAIRLKSMNKDGDKIKIYDEIKGEREIPANTKDVVLLKSDGIPPYCFAHAVDDHLMRTTLVVRGEEWFASLASHIEIFDALGFKYVKYAHTPVICKLGEEGNKRKISKSKDPEADMRFYLKDGYPKNAVIEYLLNLANSNFEEWRTKNPFADNHEFNFTAKKLGASNPMFDIMKLNDISKTIISKMNTEECFNHLYEYACSYDNEFKTYIDNNKEYVKSVLSIDREVPKPRKDIAKWSEVKDYYNFMFGEVSSYDFDKEKFSADDIKEVLKAYKEVYNETDDKVQWFERVKSVCAPLNFCADMKAYKQNPEQYKGNVADLSTIIRVAITGKRNTPDLCAIMQILGKEEVEKRIEKVISSKA